MTLFSFLLRRMAAPALCLLLVACAPQIIRDRAVGQLRDGNYEAAIHSYQEGVKEHPGDTALRAGLASARAEAMARLVSEAGQFRAQGKPDDAEKVIARGLAIEPKNERLLAVKADMVQERILRRRLEEASNLVRDGKKEQALRILESALRDSPRNQDLLAMQRRLETEVRFESGNSGRRELADQRPISLDFRNAPLSTVLEAITRGSGINFILDRDVKQDVRVTIYLRSAKVEEAIDLVTRAQQLSRRIIDQQTVLIYPNTLEKQKEHQEQVIRVFHLSSSEAKNTAAFLRSMLKIKEPYVDERSNMVAIRETPELVALAERLVALHDVADAEVMLEVEVMEVKTSRLTQLGISFPNSVTLTPLAESGTTGQTLSSIGRLNPDRIGVNVGNILLNLRREVGDFNVLANPRIRSKNREKARIVIGDKVPVVTATSSSTGFVAESVNYLDVGLKLEVEPLVSPDDDVTIKLALEVSSLAKEVRTANGTLAYQIGTRNANTTLRLRDGETQLLGGLINNEDRSSATRVPGLGDLPVAGRLFSNQLDDVQRTELVLAITPRILRSAPRPDLAQAEMWVGTEMATRLYPTPGRTPAIIRLPASEPAGSAEKTSLPNSTPKSEVPVMPQVKLTWEAPVGVKVGDVFLTTLVLSADKHLSGVPFEVTYSPEHFEVVEIIEGPFFRRDGTASNFTSALNTTDGKIALAFKRSDAKGAIGESNLIQLRLKAKAAGMGKVGIAEFKAVGLKDPVAAIEGPTTRISVK